MRATLRTVFIGVFAAFVFSGIRWVHEALPYALWSSPWSMLALSVALIALQRLSFREAPRAFMSGASELLYHVHAQPESAILARWWYFAIAALGLALFGGRAGLESASIAMAHAYALSTRGTFARWFELQRRTDAACAMAAGLAAVFGTPLAAVIFTLEIGMGGRALSLLQSVFAAAVAGHFLGRLWKLERLSFVVDHDPLAFAQWVPVFAIGFLVSCAILTVFGWVHGANRKLLRGQQIGITAVGALVLCVLVALSPQGWSSGLLHFQDVLSMPAKDPRFALSLLGGAFASIWVGIQAFGPFGVVSAVIQASLGLAVLSRDWMGLSGVGVVASATYLYGAVMLSAVLGTPLFAAVFMFELTGDWNLVVPCIVVAFAAHALRRLLRVPSLTQLELSLNSLEVEGGRAVGVLKGIPIREAMVTDHETVSGEHGLLEVRRRMETSKYPFLVVVDHDGKYAGMLTSDLVEEAWSQNKDQPKFIEARDLVYRLSHAFKPVHERDSLTLSSHLFDETPVIPVVTDGHRAVGLLFAYNVRIAYDREVGHRSMIRKGYRASP